MQVADCSHLHEQRGLLVLHGLDVSSTDQVAIERERSDTSVGLGLFPLSLLFRFFNGFRNSFRSCRDFRCSSVNQLDLGGLAVHSALCALALNAENAMVDVVLVLELVSDLRVGLLRCLDLALDVIPFVAAITSDPIFAVGDLRLRVEVDLLAEVAEIVLVVGIGAILA